MSKTISIIFLVLFSSLFSQNGNERSKEWAVTSSTVNFTIKNAGFTVAGTFSGLKAKVLFDPEKSSGSSFLATIDANSISTGNSTRDSHLRKSEYFHVAVFPLITMQSVAITKESAGLYKGIFRLSIKGIIKEITVPFKFSELTGTGTLSASFSISRTEFGVGKSSIVLSDKVDVSVVLNVRKK